MEACVSQPRAYVVATFSVIAIDSMLGGHLTSSERTMYCQCMPMNHPG